LKIQWSQHLQDIPNKTEFTLHCATSGLYQCKATNAYGTAQGNLYIKNTTPTTLVAVSPQTAKTLLTFNATISLSGQTVNPTDKNNLSQFIKDGAVKLTFQNNDMYAMRNGSVSAVGTSSVVLTNIGAEAVLHSATVTTYNIAVRNITRDSPWYDLTLTLGNKTIITNTYIVYRNLTYYTGNTVSLYDDNWLEFTTNVADLLVEN